MPASITTVKEYSFKPAERLPEVKGISAYKALDDNTVRFALNVWAGWGPIILANDGFKPGKVWKTADGKEFKIELVLIDDPVTMRDAYASGDVHIGWATLDMLPLFMEGFVDKTGQPKDSRIMPRVFQQIDWSNGGDGIVARDYVKTMADLRGKAVVLAQNSPSHYFLLNMLVAGGVQPGEVHDEIHARRLQSRGRFQRRKGAGGRRQLVARYLQLGRRQRQPHVGHHADGQQADRRRLVRPGRLRQRSHGQNRSHRPRNLRRHGRFEKGREQSPVAQS